MTFSPSKASASANWLVQKIGKFTLLACRTEIRYAFPMLLLGLCLMLNFSWTRTGPIAIVVDHTSDHSMILPTILMPYFALGGAKMAGVDLVLDRSQASRAPALVSALCCAPERLTCSAPEKCAMQQNEKMRCSALVYVLQAIHEYCRAHELKCLTKSCRMQNNSAIVKQQRQCSAVQKGFQG